MWTTEEIFQSPVIDLSNECAVPEIKHVDEEFGENRNPRIPSTRYSIVDALLPPPVSEREPVDHCVGRVRHDHVVAHGTRWFVGPGLVLTGRFYLYFIQVTIGAREHRSLRRLPYVVHHCATLGTVVPCRCVGVLPNRSVAVLHVGLAHGLILSVAIDHASDPPAIQLLSLPHDGTYSTSAPADLVWDES